MQNYKYCELSPHECAVLKLLVKNGERMTYEQINDTLLWSNNLSTTVTINSSALDLFIQRFFDKTDKKWYVELKDITFLFCENVSFIKKEKNILHFYFSTTDVVIDYDFITKNIINIDKNTILILPRIGGYPRTMLNEIFKTIIEFSDRFIPEWIFSYPDLMEKTYLYDPMYFQTCLIYLPKTIKAGYIQFCRKNELPLGYKSYRVFLVNLIFGNNKKILYFFRRIETNILPRIDFNNLKPLLLQQTFSILFKIYEYSEKHCEDISYVRLSLMATDIFQYPELLTVLDTNRGIETNNQLMQIYIDEKSNKKLAEQLQKLNFINNMIIDDYIIKVPQSIDDLIDEGKQQHNCVGSFYNESIRRGENLIYFVRRKDKPQKSYVTCRYNIEAEETVEHKLVNNGDEMLELLYIRPEIDNIIRNKLKRE